jgi:hypothetical protein
VIKIELQNMEKLRAQLGKLPKRAKDAFEAGMIEQAAAILTAAQKRVPVVTGRLRSSARVAKVKRNQYRSDLLVQYEAPYAIYVHEIPYDGHTTRGLPGAERNGEGYKWLQKAADKVIPKIVPTVIKRIQAALKGGR